VSCEVLTKAFFSESLPPLAKDVLQRVAGSSGAGRHGNFSGLQPPGGGLSCDVLSLPASRRRDGCSGITATQAKAQVPYRAVQCRRNVTSRGSGKARLVTT
jgi:hypothetical protein